MKKVLSKALSVVLIFSFAFLLMQFYIIQSEGKGGPENRIESIWGFSTAHAADKKPKESVYDRVMRTGTIRCGYFVWEPAIIKDPNTGTVSGIFYDYMEAMGKQLDLEIEWAEEADFSTYLQALNNGRYDLECSGGWPNAKRGKLVDYSTPIFYLPLYAFAKDGDTRFDNNLSAINDPDIRFAVVDGETASFIREQRFSKSELVSIPQLVGFTMLLQNVASGKADVAIYDILGSKKFMKANSGKIRRVVSDPLRVIPNNLSVPAHEYRFLNMMNTATRELLYDGVIDRILDKYEQENDAEGLLLRVAKPYEVSE